MITDAEREAWGVKSERQEAVERRQAEGVQRRLRDCLDRMQDQAIREREIRAARNQFGVDPRPETMSNRTLTASRSRSALAPRECLDPDSTSSVAA